MTINERISSLRKAMVSQGIDAYLISGTDPHLSEYVPDAWKSRAWISGFTGSYGKVAITANRAALWTDSRYFIQAAAQLEGTGIEMIKDRLADTIGVDQWLGQILPQGGRVAMDGLTISAVEALALEDKLDANGYAFDLRVDLLSQIWTDRPSMPSTPITDFPVLFAGSSRSEKLTQIRNRLTQTGTEAMMICQLDELAWSFNLRGGDICFNPLFTGYGYVDHHQAILFVDKEKISDKICDDLFNEGIQTRSYHSVMEFLDASKSQRYYTDVDRMNALIYRKIAAKNIVVQGVSIPTQLKSIKNSVEQKGMRQAHLRDGVALVNFLYWFDHHFGKIKITELDFANKLKEFRAQQDHFMGESFSPIVSFGAHGAIVHYSATPETNAEILPDSLLLFDTGGQYLDGTTDITRTIATGKITDKQKFDFTLVLKGMIQLAKAVFPENTKGYSLDTFARNALWKHGLNFGHGTGHGVGHYLCVHEGPMSIRPEYNSEPIFAGQVITDEPGLYRAGEYGIRCENVLLCGDHQQTDFGKFLSFDTLTRCPFDRNLIDRTLLSKDEMEWLNNYHATIITELGSYLGKDVLDWLTQKCAPI